MENIISNFERNGFAVSYFKNSADAVLYLKEKVVDTTVTFGGSMTCSDLDLHSVLADRNKVFYHAVDGFVTTDSKVYIASANALAKTGEVINIDGRGNRVANMIHGAETVYLVCGVNKLCDDIPTALHRASNIAAPLNSRRLSRKTPCTKGEIKCHNCNSPERICRSTVIMTKKTGAVQHFEIILIDEILGY